MAGATGRGDGILGRLARPGALIPIVLGLALLVSLLAFGDVRRVVALLGAFRTHELLAILLVRLAYEVVQFAQWSLLLRAAGLRTTPSARAFAYFVGAVARVLPIGNYFGNYLLLQEEGADFGRSAAATTVSVLIEVAGCLAALALLGLGAWGWLRPLIVVGLALFLPVAWALHHRYRAGVFPSWLTRRRGLRALLMEVRQFEEGAAALARPRWLIVAALLGVGYLLLGGTTLYLVAVLGLDLSTVGLPAAFSVYCFSVAFALIVPLPIDLGVYEAGGAGAFLAIGVDRGDAVAAMLVMRALSSGAAALLALAACLLWPERLRAAWRGQDHLSSQR